MLGAHVQSCVATAFSGQDADEQATELAELLDVLEHRTIRRPAVEVAAMVACGTGRSFRQRAPRRAPTRRRVPVADLWVTARPGL
jgi:hypothetical protein